MSGFTPGGSLWKLSFVVTLKPGENSAPMKPAAVLSSSLSIYSVLPTDFMQDEV